MASILKEKALKGANKLATPTSSPDPDSDAGTDEPPEKYLLSVTAGPDYPGTQTPVAVNSNQATQVENEFMIAKVKVRIRGFRGLPRGSPSHTPYFDHPMHVKDQYSVGLSFVPKIDIPGDDLWFGNDFDHPVRDRLPPGFNQAMKIVTEFIDPGIEADAYSDTPWLLAPALDCWFRFRIGEKLSEDQLKDIPHPDEDKPLEEGADGSGLEIRDRLKIPQGEKRRKFYLSPSRRAEFVFEKGRLYQADFFNPYLDFNNFALRLPGFKIRVLRYINDKTHNLRYVLKNRKTGDAYIVINIALLFGQELQQALQAEEQRTQQKNSTPILDENSETPDGCSVALPAPVQTPHQEFFDAKPI